MIKGLIRSDHRLNITLAVLCLAGAIAGRERYVWTLGTPCPSFPYLRFERVNPARTEARLYYLGASYVSQLSFMCDPERQHLLPHGRPGEVEEYVREITSGLGHHGGGIIGWACLGPDVPWEYIETLVRAFAQAE